MAAWNAIFMLIGLAGTALMGAAWYWLPSPWDSIALVVAIGCFALAAAAAMDSLADRLNLSVHSLSEAWIRVANPQIVEMEKIANMSEQQIILYFGGEGIDEVWDVDTVTQIFRALGREFRAVDLKAYIEKSEAMHPNCMSLSRHGNGATEQMDERAYLYVLKHFGLVRSRDGRTYVWNKPIDEVLKHFEFDEVTG